MWSRKKERERKNKLNLCSWYHSAFSMPMVKLWLLSSLSKSPEAENQGESLLSWIISSHFSSGWAKNNTGIAFFEHSYSLLAGTEKVRKMKVNSSGGKESQHTPCLYGFGWDLFAGSFGFFTLISTWLTFFLHFSPLARDGESWVLWSYWSKKYTFLFKNPWETSPNLDGDDSTASSILRSLSKTWDSAVLSILCQDSRPAFPCNGYGFS